MGPLHRGRVGFKELEDWAIRSAHKASAEELWEDFMNMEARSAKLRKNMRREMREAMLCCLRARVSDSVPYRDVGE